MIRDISIYNTSHSCILAHKLMIISLELARKAALLWKPFRGLTCGIDILLGSSKWGLQIAIKVSPSIGWVWMYFSSLVMYAFESCYAMCMLPRWFSGKESAYQCRRCRFDPKVGKIPSERKWQPTSVSLPGKSLGQRNLVGPSPWG